VDSELKKIRKWVQFMRKEGVLTLKSQGIELSLAPHALFPDSATPEAPIPLSSESAPAASEAFSEDQILFWSAPGSEADPEKPAS
jgi:hypothetical protein